MKHTFFLLMFCLCFSCKKYENKDGMITTKLSLDVVESPKNTYFKTGFIVHMTIQNNSSKKLYFLRPDVMVHHSNEHNSIYAFGGTVDLRNSDQVPDIVEFEDPQALLLTKKYRTNDIIYDNDINNAIFLRPKQFRKLSYSCYGFFKEKQQKFVIHSTNIAFREQPYAFTIFDNLPPVFNGYSFWVGKVRPDTLLLNTFKE